VKGLVVDQKPQIPRKPKKEEKPEPVVVRSEKANGKRPADDSDVGTPLAKRPKVADKGDDIILIDDDEVISLE
jgi:hypothetical protein